MVILEIVAGAGEEYGKCDERQTDMGDGTRIDIFEPRRENGTGTIFNIGGYKVDPHVRIFTVFRCLALGYLFAQTWVSDKNITSGFCPGARPESVTGAISG